MYVDMCTIKIIVMLELRLIFCYILWYRKQTIQTDGRPDCIPNHKPLVLRLTELNKTIVFTPMFCEKL